MSEERATHDLDADAPIIVHAPPTGEVWITEQAHDDIRDRFGYVALAVYLEMVRRCTSDAGPPGDLHTAMKMSLPRYTAAVEQLVQAGYLAPRDLAEDRATYLVHDPAAGVW